MKKIVQYKGNPPIGPRVGHHAVVFPVDHPDAENVSNEKYVRTSKVIHVGENGEFETLNTKYVPEKQNAEA